MKKLSIVNETLPVQNGSNVGKIVAILSVLTLIGLIVAYFVQQDNKAKENEKKKVPEYKIKTQAIPNGSN